MGIYIYQFNCSKCSAVFEDKLNSNTDDYEVRCPFCKSQILQAHYYNGYIYILSNPSFPNLFKVGCTERTVQERVEELSKSTSLPNPFFIEVYYISKNPFEDEKQIHDLLNENRINDKREFFETDLVFIDGLIVNKMSLRRDYVGTKLRVFFEEEERKKELEAQMKKDKEKLVDINIRYCSKCKMSIQSPGTARLTDYALEPIRKPQFRVV